LDRDVWTLLCVLAVELEPLLEARLAVRLDGVDRALPLAHPAADAPLGVDDEHVLALVEAVDRAHRDAIGGLALDALLIDDVGHSPFRCTVTVAIATNRSPLSPPPAVYL